MCFKNVCKRAKQDDLKRSVGNMPGFIPTRPYYKTVSTRNHLFLIYMFTLSRFLHVRCVLALAFALLTGEQLGLQHFCVSRKTVCSLAGKISMLVGRTRVVPAVLQCVPPHSLWPEFTVRKTTT